jgi:hypothetical protein
VENKFINEQTLSYLQSQVGQSTPQRLDDIETNLKNILDFLKEYEGYQDSRSEDLSQKLSVATASIFELQHDLQGLTLHTDSRITKSNKLILGLLAVLTVAFGVALCLIK